MARHRPERGALATWAAVVLPAFILLVGLGVDLAGHAAAEQEARAVAAEAARSGGQYLLIAPGTRAQPDTSRAAAAARAYLGSSGYTGSVAVAPDGSVTVVVTGEYETLFLGIIGIDSLRLEGEASARATSVIDGNES